MKNIYRINFLDYNDSNIFFIDVNGILVRNKIKQISSL
jgi:hypothetical protein